MRIDQLLSEHGDGQHTDIGLDEDGHIEATCQPDYDELDRRIFGVEEPEDTVSFSDMTAALSLIVGWATGSPNIKHVGGRICALQILLDPTNAGFGRATLNDIAQEAGVTRAAVSRWLIDFRDQVGVSLTVGKRNSARVTASKAQKDAFANGTHAAFNRKDKPVAKAA